jgi:hypothetical protein
MQAAGLSCHRRQVHEPAWAVVTCNAAYAPDPLPVLILNNVRGFHQEIMKIHICRFNECTVDTLSPPRSYVVGTAPEGEKLKSGTLGGLSYSSVISRSTDPSPGLFFEIRLLAASSKVPSRLSDNFSF